MKKFAWLFAALSISACSFVACDDDDDNDKGGTGIGTTCDKTASDCGAGTKFDSVNCQCVSDAGTGGGIGTGGEALAGVGESCIGKACASGLVCNAAKICEKSGAIPACDKKKSDCNADEILDTAACQCVKENVSEFAEEYESCESKACVSGLTCDPKLKICLDNSIAEDHCEMTNPPTIMCLKIDNSEKYTASSCEGGKIKNVLCPDDCKEGIGCVESNKDVECNEFFACADPKKTCVNNKCVDTPASGNECDDMGHANCDDNKICSAGKCVVKPVVGSDCDDSFVCLCDGVHKIIICSGKKVVTRQCSSGSACWQNKTGAGECVEPCMAPLVENSIQYSDCDKDANTAYNYICAKDFYGNVLMAFENTTACGSKKCQANDDPYTGEPAVCK